jgi:hypothetical protein
MNAKLIAATNAIMAEVLREAANIIEGSSEVIEVYAAIDAAIVKMAEISGTTIHFGTEH